MLKDKKVLAGGAVLMVAVFWFFIKPQFMDSKPAPTYTAEQIAAAPKPTLTLEERVLNLKSPTTAPNYVKVSLALELADPKHGYINLKGAGITAANLKLGEEMKPSLPRIWDVIIRVVGSKPVDQVATPDGQEALKAELIDNLNKELDADHKVVRINFVTWITQ